MSWGFVEGQVYNRLRDIHHRFNGGSQRNGIISIPRSRLVIAVTGDEGKEFGYHDRWRPDGGLDYFGQGSIGDMQMASGNRVIAEHSHRGWSLLVFSTVKGGLKYRGEFVCEGFSWETSNDGFGDPRNALVFHLKPLGAIEIEAAADPSPNTADDLDTLREAAYDASSPDPARYQRIGSVFARSRKVADYVIHRSRGSCEGCEQPAPFLKPNGTPYLEPHHVHRLSDGGPDNPRTVIALCPTCHRRVHFGAGGQTYNAALITKLECIEQKKRT